MDWVMRNTTDGNTGIQWSLTKQLEHLDFVDDVNLLFQKQKNAQTKLTRLADEAGKVSLKINTRKTEVMRIKNKQECPLKLHWDDI